MVQRVPVVIDANLLQERALAKLDDTREKVVMLGLEIACCSG